jgi:peptidyl-prolyl cis-trans isomerase D
MFDLFRNREKVKKIMMGGILLVVSASMLLYLVPNYGGGGGANDPVIAQIGGQSLTEVEVRQMIRNQTRGRQIPPEVVPNYVPTILDQMIKERAMAYEAEKLGLQVTDKDVADYIRQSFPNLFPDGKFVGKDVYAAFMAQQGMNYEDFEADLKREMLLTRLRRIALEATLVTPTEIEQEYRKKYEQIKIQYVKLSPDKYKKEVEPKPEELQAFFKANSARYMVPEKKSLIILVADQAKIEQNLNPTDAQLMVLYNQNQANFRMPERVHVRHILIMTQGKPAGDETKLKAKAEDLLKQVKAGADFAKLAKENSEDPGSKDKGGEYWVTRGQMVPEFEKAAFTMKPGQTSDLVKTQYGYHIIQVMAHEDARLKPFAEVKDDLAKNWKTEQASAMMQQISDKAQAALQKDPTHPDKVAADLGMQVVHADAVTPGQSLPEVGSNPDFDQSVSTLKKGEVSQTVALSPTKVALAEVVDIIPSHPSTFEEVQNSVRDAMTNARLPALVAQKAKQLADSARADGGDLAKAAKAMGLEVKTSEPFKRLATVEGIGPASYVEDGFKGADGAILNPIPMSDQTVVVKVLEHIAPDMSKLLEERATVRDKIKQDKARERAEMFENGLINQLTKKGVVKLHEDAIRRLLASYRAG